MSDTGRIADALERIAAALEAIVDRDEKPAKRARPKPIKVSDTDRASAAAAARRIGLVVHEPKGKR